MRKSFQILFLKRGYIERVLISEKYFYFQEIKYRFHKCIEHLSIEYQPQSNLIFLLFWGPWGLWGQFEVF